MGAFNRHCEKCSVFTRLLLGEHALKIPEIKKLVGIKASSYSTIRRYHCEFKTKKWGNNTGKPNGHPKSALNDNKVAAVAKLVKEDPHICIREVRGFLFCAEQFREWRENVYYLLQPPGACGS